MIKRALRCLFHAAIAAKKRRGGSVIFKVSTKWIKQKLQHFYSRKGAKENVLYVQKTKDHSGNTLCKSRTQRIAYSFTPNKKLKFFKKQVRIKSEYSNTNNPLRPSFSLCVFA